MRVRINRNVCDAQLAFCERCLGRFLLYPEGYERHCFEELEDDGKDELTIELHTGDRTVTLTLNEEERKMAAGEGWASLVGFDVPMYREKTEERKETPPKAE
jgi:hypothetical protein